MNSPTRSPSPHPPRRSWSRSRMAAVFDRVGSVLARSVHPQRRALPGAPPPPGSDRLEVTVQKSGFRNLAFSRCPKPWWPAALAATCLSAASIGAQAQAIVMAGVYQNFDVLNNTGAPTYGFEMEVWGVSKSQLTRIFPSNFYATVIRYGFGTATDFPGGVYVRWIAPWDPATATFTTATPVPPSLTSVPGDSCWRLGMPTTYDTAGCEHFGISSVANPTKILYRWLVADPANPGSVKPVVSTFRCRRRSGSPCRPPTPGCRRSSWPRSRPRRRHGPRCSATPSG